MIAGYIKMKDDWMSETIIGGTMSWEEQLDGTYTQIVYLRLKNGSTIEQRMREGVNKKEYFMLQLKGDTMWPPTETMLTTGTR